MEAPPLGFGPPEAAASPHLMGPEQCGIKVRGAPFTKAQRTYTHLSFTLRGAALEPDPGCS